MSEFQERPPLQTPNQSEGWPAVIALLQVVLQESHRQALQIAGLHKDIQNYSSEIQQLAKILRDDGPNSLIIRIALLEQLAKDNVEIKKMLDNRSLESEKGRWSLSGVVATAAFSLLGIIITALLALLVKGAGVKP